MTQILSSPHTHTRYADGKNTPREMIRAAIDMGFGSLGFSEHGHQHFDADWCMSAESEGAYIAEITALQAEFAGRLRIWRGIERDALGDSDRAAYQYVIGSKHYFKDGDFYFAVDSDIPQVTRGIERSFGGDGGRMARAYFRDLAAYVCAYRPDIIGHFDLPTKFNDGNRFFDAEDKRYLSAGFEALEAMRETDAILEINTGAIARGYRATPYPAPAFLARWREAGGRIILSSDCHDATKLDCAYDLARSLAVQAGFREVWALGEGDERFVPCAL